METLHIKVKDKEVYKHLLWFLKKFDESELQFVEGEMSFSSIQKELQEELHKIDNGTSKLMDISQVDKDLESIISQYEH